MNSLAARSAGGVLGVLCLWKGGDDSEGTPSAKGWERRIVLSILPFMVAFKIDFRLVTRNPLLILCILLQFYYYNAAGKKKQLEK